MDILCDCDSTGVTWCRISDPWAKIIFPAWPYLTVSTGGCWPWASMSKAFFLSHLKQAPLVSVFCTSFKFSTYKISQRSLYVLGNFQVSSHHFAHVWEQDDSCVSNRVPMPVIDWSFSSSFIADVNLNATVKELHFWINKMKGDNFLWRKLSVIRHQQSSHMSDTSFLCRDIIFCQNLLEVQINIRTRVFHKQWGSRSWKLKAFSKYLPRLIFLNKIIEFGRLASNYSFIKAND